MTPVTYGDATRHLKTQLHVLQEFGVREDRIFTDAMTGSSMTRPAWNEWSPHSRPSGIILRLRPVVRMGLARIKNARLLGSWRTVDSMPFVVYTALESRLATVSRRAVPLLPEPQAGRAPEQQLAWPLRHYQRSRIGSAPAMVACQFPRAWMPSLRDRRR